MIPFLQKTSEAWLHWVLAGLLESTVMLVLVLLIWGVIRKRCSQGVGYVLFLLVMVKMLIPVGIPVPGFLVAEGGNREEETLSPIPYSLSPLPSRQIIRPESIVWPTEIRSDAEKIANSENRDAHAINEDQNLLNEYPGAINEELASAGIFVQTTDTEEKIRPNQQFWTKTGDR